MADSLDPFARLDSLCFLCGTEGLLPYLLDINAVMRTERRALGILIVATKYVGRVRCCEGCGELFERADPEALARHIIHLRDEAVGESHSEECVGQRIDALIPSMEVFLENGTVITNG